jgi:hypothetical protein
MTEEIECAIASLKSFRDGDFGVACVVACGEQAIPALRAVLFEREPSGLYQVRCRAVDALAALGAHDVLIEFLEAQPGAADPVERMGEDAVINAAALALANARDRYVFELLLRLANRACLTGVIGAVGAYASAEAIPVLVNALEDDASRLTAEAALKNVGVSARAALVHAAGLKLPSGDHESESSIRRRRSALRLLFEMSVPFSVWPALRPLVDDTDAKVALLACQICLNWGPAADRRPAACRLVALLARDDWLLRDETESTLVAHFEETRDTIEFCLREVHPGRDAEGSAQINEILRRVVSRAHSGQKSA